MWIFFFLYGFEVYRESSWILTLEVSVSLVVFIDIYINVVWYYDR